MDNLIIKAFQLYYKKYSNIFKIFYPATDSDGFVECNQTIHFCNALINIQKDINSFYWLEVSVPKTKSNFKKGHIDAVLIYPDNKTIYYIESKRLSTYRNNFDNRVNSISSDFERILDIEVRNSIKKRIDTEIHHEFIICLADFWISDDYEEIPNKKWIKDINNVNNENIIYLSKRIEKQKDIKYKEEETILNYCLHLAYYKI